MNRLKLLVFAAGIIAAIILLSMGSCARVGNPVGGPRDSIPPVLLRTEPNQSATVFKGKRVRLYFDEFPAIKDQDKELLISPPMKKRVGMTVKGKSVIVDFRDDSLLRNTTYRLMFGKSIVDNNEGNALADLNFVFSTGKQVDTLMLRGALYDAQTAMPIIGAMAMAYEGTNDSLVYFGRPDKVARTDSAGVFSLYNLKAKPYRIVVLEDVNNNFMYDVGSEKIGFTVPTWNPVAPRPKPQYKSQAATQAEEAKRKKEHKHEHPGENSTSLVYEMPALDIDLISAFKEPNTKQFILGVQRNERRAIKLMFNAPNPVIDSLQLLPMKNFDYQVQANAQRDTLIYWLTNPEQEIPDSLVLHMNYLRTDTANRLVPIKYKSELMFKGPVSKDARKEKKSGGIAGFIKGLAGTDTTKVSTDSLRKAAKFTVIPRFIGGTPLVPAVGLKIQFAAPLIHIDTARISMTKLKINSKTKDTTTTVVPFRLIPEPNKLGTYQLDATWETDAIYLFKADTSVFNDIYGKTNNFIKEKLITPNPEKMSSISIRFTGMQEGVHYVVYLLNETGALIRQKVIDSDKYVFSFLASEKYKLRILEDVNGNGVQDIGDFSKKRLPERMANVGGVGAESVINLREGWEVEQAIKLNELFR